jgi:heme/copper-type cytochrome/quinol oxidase subunit 3
LPRVACGTEVVLMASVVAAFAARDGEAESRQKKMMAAVTLATMVLHTLFKVSSCD